LKRQNISFGLNYSHTKQYQNKTHHGNAFKKVCSSFSLSLSPSLFFVLFHFSSQSKRGRLISNLSHREFIVPGDADYRRNTDFTITDNARRYCPSIGAAFYKFAIE